MNRLFKINIAILSILCMQSAISMEQQYKGSGIKNLRAAQDESEVDSRIEKLRGEISDINDEIDLHPQEVLFDHGLRVVRVEAKNSQKKTTTLLKMAIKGGSIQIIHKLIEAGARLDDIEDPIALAMRRSRSNSDTLTHLPILREFLSHGVKINDVLLTAISEQDLEVVRMLVEDYDMTITDKDVAQASCPLLKKEPNLGIVLYLRSKSQNGIEDILGKFDNIWCPTEEMVALFLKNGANVDATDQMDEAYLFKAIRNSNYNLVRLLVENGADVNKPNRYHLPLDLVKELIKNPSLCITQHDENLKKIHKLLKDKGAKSSSKCLVM